MPQERRIGAQSNMPQTRNQADVMVRLASSPVVSTPAGFRPQELANTIWALATCGTGLWGTQHFCMLIQNESVVESNVKSHEIPRVSVLLKQT